MTETEKRGRDWMGAVLLLVELGCMLVGLFGIWLMSQPVSYVVGGALGIIAMERLQARREDSQLHARVRQVAARRLPGGRAA